MAYVAAVIVGLLYGAVDQYLGSLTFLVHFGRWPSTASQMSAPWLVLPFLLGCSQVRARRAALLGLVVTEAALIGYFAMTVSPLEGVPLGFHRQRGAKRLRNADLECRSRIERHDEGVHVGFAVILFLRLRER